VPKGKASKQALKRQGLRTIPQRVSPTKKMVILIMTSPNFVYFNYGTEKLPQSVPKGKASWTSPKGAPTFRRESWVGTGKFCATFLHDITFSEKKIAQIFPTVPVPTRRKVEPPKGPGKLKFFSGKVFQGKFFHGKFFQGK
jgi:hypothetical protein